MNEVKGEVWMKLEKVGCDCFIIKHNHEQQKSQ